MTENQKITIVDIAKRANVSPSTVSRVLRGTTSVSNDKHQAVMEAVTALNYQPNVFAQSLASGQSMTIGVLTQNFGSPFYDGIMLGILQGLEKTPYSPLFVDGRWQRDVEERALQTLMNRRVDGLILIGGQIEEDTIREIARRIPVILVARQLLSMPNHCVATKNYEAAVRATEYLIEMGHRHIAYISASMPYDDYVNDIDERLRGFTDAMLTARVQIDPQLMVQGNLRRQSGVLAVETLISRGRPFSAIFAANDQMAFGARYALYHRGIRVPEDVSLVGFDDEPPAAYMIPPLTTVRQPANDMGTAAARAILGLISGEIPEAIQFEADLIIRESVQYPR